MSTKKSEKNKLYYHLCIYISPYICDVYFLIFLNNYKGHKSFSNITNDKNMKIPEAIVISSDNVLIENILLH